MATNIEINYYNGSEYEALYPKSDWNNMVNQPTIPTMPDLSSYAKKSDIPDTSSFVTKPVYINEGGTQATTASKAIYNLVNGCSSINTSYLHNTSYREDVFLTGYYGSTGYKIGVNDLIGNFYTATTTFSVTTSESVIRSASIAPAPLFMTFNWTSGTLTVEGVTLANAGTMGALALFLPTDAYYMKDVNGKINNLLNYNITVKCTTSTTLTVMTAFGY